MADGSPEPNITWSVFPHYLMFFEDQARSNISWSEVSMVLLRGGWWLFHWGSNTCTEHVLKQFDTQVQRWLRSVDCSVKSEISPSDPSHWQSLLPQGDAEQEGGCKLATSYEE